jgi:hypothetical protein
MLVSFFTRYAHSTGVHGDYPDIAAFTGLQHAELVLEDVVDKVDTVIEVTTMPVTPTSTDLQELYAPLRTIFEETYGAECNVLFKVGSLPLSCLYKYGVCTAY